MLRSGYDRGETGVEGAWVKLPLEVRQGFEATALRLAAEQKQRLHYSSARRNDKFGGMFTLTSKTDTSFEGGFNDDANRVTGKLDGPPWYPG